MILGEAHVGKILSWANVDSVALFTDLGKKN